MTRLKKKSLIVNPGRAKVGHVLHQVYCEIAIDNGGRLSICGVIGPYSNGSCAGGCGQIDETIASDGFNAIVEFNAGWDAELLETFLGFWNAYHLNDMRPYCVHQEVLGWHKRKLDPNGAWVQDNKATWTYEHEHPRGVLAKPCPVCGYEYGTEWKQEDVPMEVLDWLFDLPMSEVTPPWV